MLNDSICFSAQTCLGIQQNKNKVKEKLIELFSSHPVVVLVEASKRMKKTSGTSFRDLVPSSCLKRSTMGVVAGYLDDPFAYYANNVKILIDKVSPILFKALQVLVDSSEVLIVHQKDYGYYLSRLFFAQPKQRLMAISAAFDKIYHVSLLEYIRYQLKEVVSWRLVS